MRQTNKVLSTTAILLCFLAPAIRSQLDDTPLSRLRSHARNGPEVSRRLERLFHGPATKATTDEAPFEQLPDETDEEEGSSTSEKITTSTLRPGFGEPIWSVRLPPGLPTGGGGGGEAQGPRSRIVLKKLPTRPLGTIFPERIEQISTSTPDFFTTIPDETATDGLSSIGFPSLISPAPIPGFPATDTVDFSSIVTSSAAVAPVEAGLTDIYPDAPDNVSPDEGEEGEGALKSGEATAIPGAELAAGGGETEEGTTDGGEEEVGETDLATATPATVEEKTEETQPTPAPFTTATFPSIAAITLPSPTFRQRRRGRKKKTTTAPSMNVAFTIPSVLPPPPPAIPAALFPPPPAPPVVPAAAVPPPVAGLTREMCASNAETAAKYGIKDIIIWVDSNCLLARNVFPFATCEDISRAARWCYL